MDIRDPLRHYPHYQDPSPKASPYAGGSSFMERMSEAVASGMGTVPFIVISMVVILGWVFANGAAHYIHTTFQNIAHGKEFDAEPWILLNLIFSAVAFFTGALVIIAQKAQTRTDKANELAAAQHREELDGVNKKLLEENTNLTKQIHVIAEKLATLTEEVHLATCRGGAAQGALPAPGPPGP